jgi:hypothetical protein
LGRADAISGSNNNFYGDEHSDIHIIVAIFAAIIGVIPNAALAKKHHHLVTMIHPHAPHLHPLSHLHPLLVQIVNKLSQYFALHMIWETV